MVLIIGILLIEPIFDLFSWNKITPKLAILVDNSKSMGLDEGGSSRLSAAETAVSPIIDDTDIHSTVFDFSADFSKSKDLPAQVSSSGDATSIANALTELSRIKDLDDYRSVLLVSDGRQNLGKDPIDPAIKLGIPVNTLTVGEKKANVNIAINDLAAPAAAFASDTFKVEVRISGEGITSKKSKIYIKKGNQIIAEKAFDIPSEGRQASVEFEIPAPAPGRYIYTVGSPVLEGETESVDNKRMFSINILKNRVKILLASDALNWEYKFALQSLRHYDEFDITAVYPIRKGQFAAPGPPRGYDDLANFDAVILIDCGPEDVRITRPNMKRYVDGGGALIYLAGAGCISDLRLFEDLLPIEVVGLRINQGEYLYEPSVTRKQHAAILLDENPDISAKIWQSLPPFNDIIYGIRAKGDVLLETNTDIPNAPVLPVLTVGEYGRGRTAAITGFPLWRSLFGARRGGETAIPTFWKNLVRWATAKHGTGNFEIVSDRDVYRLGEPIKMTGYLYDDSNNPKSGALIEISVFPKNESTAIKDAVLNQTGAGIYQGEIISLGSGDYDYKAAALSYGDTLGQFDGKFSIEPYSLELASSAPDYNLTRRISEATGGKAYTIDNFSEFSNDLNLTPFEREKHTRIKPFGMPLFLIILVSGLCIEWGVRKRLRLP